MELGYLDLSVGRGMAYMVFHLREKKANCQLCRKMASKYLAHDSTVTRWTHGVTPAVYESDKITARDQAKTFQQLQTVNTIFKSNTLEFNPHNNEVKQTLETDFPSYINISRNAQLMYKTVSAENYKIIEIHICIANTCS